MSRTSGWIIFSFRPRKYATLMSKLMMGGRTDGHVYIGSLLTTTGSSSTTTTTLSHSQERNYILSSSHHSNYSVFFLPPSKNCGSSIEEHFHYTYDACMYVCM